MTEFQFLDFLEIIFGIYSFRVLRHLQLEKNLRFPGRFPSCQESGSFPQNRASPTKESPVELAEGVVKTPFANLSFLE